MEDLPNGYQVNLSKWLSWRRDLYWAIYGLWSEWTWNKVLKLNKALYGFKQALRAWYSRIDGYFLKNEFVKCPHEYVIYVKIKENDDIVIVYLYVDELVFTRNNPKMLRDFKQAMIKKFKMIDIGLIT